MLKNYTNLGDEKDFKKFNIRSNELSERLSEKDKIDDLIDEALVKKANFVKKSKRDMKTIKFNPNFSHLSNSRKRSKLQLHILNQFYM